MCWTCKKPDRKLANTNIHVFKLVYYDMAGNIYSVYNNFKYEINWLYTKHIPKKFKFEIDNETGDRIIRGEMFHSYKYSKIYFKIKDNLFDAYKSKIVLFTTHRSGIAFKHAILDIMFTYSQKYDCKLGVMKCIIPKGATYYLNSDGEYVSNAIKPYKLIDIESYVKLSETYKRR